MIRELEDEFSLVLLIDFGTKFNSALDHFDIETIEQMIKDFPLLLTKVQPSK